MNEGRKCAGGWRVFMIRSVFNKNYIHNYIAVLRNKQIIICCNLSNYEVLNKFNKNAIGHMD